MTGSKETPSRKAADAHVLELSQIPIPETLTDRARAEYIRAITRFASDLASEAARLSVAESSLSRRTSPSEVTASEVFRASQTLTRRASIRQSAGDVWRQRASVVLPLATSVTAAITGFAANLGTSTPGLLLFSSSAVATLAFGAISYIASRERTGDQSTSTALEPADPAQFLIKFRDVERAIDAAFASTAFQHDSPASISDRIEHLLSTGTWSADDSRDFRKVVSVRNSFVHGRVPDVEPGDLIAAIRTLDQLQLKLTKNRSDPLLQ